MASDHGSNRAPIVGVLALQGDFADHQSALAACGLLTRQVRSPAQLRGVDALVLPGGESTTMIRLLHVEGLWEPLRSALQSGVPVMATCAGLILLSQRVEQPEQQCYGLLPLTVVRNGYGRQQHSGTFALSVEDEALPRELEGTFIRAPRITAVHGECEVLARRDGDPVLVRKGSLLAACFHPELTVGHPVTRLFAEAVRAASATASRSVAVEAV
ncbi:MAG: pyridoxal 5'-phosphate synthase glutaminase subunit PdxT [Planctomycetota bacterium]|nr:pyridoxal 5'-phosphate synthase glutaminase subunit PdxT [Planctomycetota bacterium]